MVTTLTKSLLNLQIIWHLQNTQYTYHLESISNTFATKTQYNESPKGIS